MKKVLAIVLSVAMLACFAIPALAADPVTFEMTSDKAYVQPGESFVVSVRLTSGAVSTAMFNMQYDIDTLTVKPTSLKKGELGNLADATAGNVLTSGEELGVVYDLAFTYPTSEYDYEDNVLFSATFAVPEDAQVGDKYEIKLAMRETPVVAEGGENVEVTVNEIAPLTVEVGPEPVDEPSEVPSDETPVDPSSTETPSTDTPTTPSTTTPSTANPKTGDAGVAVFAAIVAAAAAAAFVAGKKKA